MKKLIRAIALLSSFAGICAMSLPDTPPCDGGINEKACFVHQCDQGKDHCTWYLFNYTYTTTCDVWCCPAGSGWVLEWNNCGAWVPDGCCSNLATTVDNGPVCPTGG